jgi:2-polyprenyl-3-methyl-5-hydroxy-6-metoxy-1,4-benzoquinol methylase
MLIKWKKSFSRFTVADKTDLEWSKLFTHRDRIHNRYREIWDVPLIKKRAPLLKRVLKNGMAILDVGAGARGMKKDIEALGLTVDYKSMDIDRTVKHEFYDLQEITGDFDVIICFEVIEHLSLEEGLALAQRLFELTKKDGLVILSTPNIFNPSRYFRDATHKTFYPYDEFCGILAMAGFKIEEVYRSFNDAFHRYVTKVYVLGWLFRLLSIDYASSIFVVARKA